MLLQSSENDGHKHVLLSPDPRKNPGVEFEEAAFSVGIYKDHTHEVEFNPQTGSWFLLPSEDHTHTVNINDAYVDKDLVKDKEVEMLATFDSKMKRALSYEKKSVKKANKAYKYLDQDQWDAADMEALKKEGRPALQFDQIGPNTDKIIGYFLQRFFKHLQVCFSFVQLHRGVVSKILRATVWTFKSTSVLPQYLISSLDQCLA